MTPVHSRILLWMDLGGLLAEAAGASVKQMSKALKPRRHGAFKTRRPGEDTPLWNTCTALIREELKHYGSKTRLARYLGIPKQRLNNFLKDSSRMPDAETALQMLNWLAHKKAGEDLSL